MLDGLDVIHMNGRIYDPTLGRFLQADPVIQAPGNPQNWNAYSYVFNNPYKYTDPSGLSASGNGDTNTFRQILAIFVVVIANMIVPGSGMVLWQAMLTGAISGAVAGGLKGGIAGALSAGLFYGIGSCFQNASWAQAGSGGGAFGTGLNAAGFGAKVLTHGIAGGVMARLQGGKFGNGFVSAGMTQAFSPGIDLIGGGAPSAAAQRIVAAAILGGVVSEMTGGKFANGAMTAAFSRAFNDEHGKSAIKKTNPGTVTRGGVGARGEATGDQLAHRMRLCLDPDQISQTIDKHLDGIDINNEWGRNDLRYVYTLDVGWIDLKHVTVAGSIPELGEELGEWWESRQAKGKWAYSSGAAEDRNSNRIGENSTTISGRGMSFSQAAQMFIGQLRPVDCSYVRQKFKP
jgi:RHS repeat-associated protein